MDLQEPMEAMRFFSSDANAIVWIMSADLGM